MSIRKPQLLGRAVAILAVVSLGLASPLLTSPAYAQGMGLTFDDGPSTFTPMLLDTLEHVSTPNDPTVERCQLVVTVTDDESLATGVATRSVDLGLTNQQILTEESDDVPLTSFHHGDHVLASGVLTCFALNVNNIEVVFGIATDSRTLTVQ